MGLFSRKEEIPEIPEAPRLPEMAPIRRYEKKELPELPHISTNYNTEELNQEMERSLMDKIPTPGQEEDVSAGEFSLATELKSRGQTSSSMSMTSIPEPPMRKPERKMTRELEYTKKEKDLNKENEPIFIRIDKFNSAQKNFEDIKEKVEDIELALAKIKEIKAKEEEEIALWGREIENLKSKFQEIDSEIFEQV